jgi:hypothetical protein
VGDWLRQTSQQTTHNQPDKKINAFALKNFGLFFCKPDFFCIFARSLPAVAGRKPRER